MSDQARKKGHSAPKDAKPVHDHDDDRFEDEEKILDGRYDVNYPAMLTKDVPGG
jgi:hypothetical protein